LAAVALLVLGGVELFVVHPQARRIATVSIEEALKPPAVVRWLKQDPELFRIFSLWSLNPVVYPLGRLHALLPAGVPAIWGIDTTGVSLSLYLKRTLVVMEAARYALLYDQRAAERLARFLGAVNVKYVIAEPARVLPGWQPAFVSEDAIVWRNPHFQPRLFLVGHVVAERLNEESSPPAAADSAFRGLREKLADWSLFQGDATAFERIMTDAVDYSRTAVVDADPLPEVGPVDPGATVEFEWGRDEIRARVNTASPALLVISNSFHSGWTATLNGLPAPIHRTNWLVMGVRVPAGASNLTLTYSTPGLYLGAGISCFSLVLFVAIAATSTRRRLLTKRPGAE
jgi:hypothetical protein